MFIDVRSPCEYACAHIPGARNLALFSDEERQQVGLLYKEQGQATALELGLNFVGPKLSFFINEAKNLKAPLTIYCARGGMRSEAMAWLLSFAGIKIERLAGGYKSYRQKVLATFQKPWKLELIGGLTGVGKTAELHRLKQEGHQILDLEETASHRGSAFGWIAPQPTTEHFENLIAESLLSLNSSLPLFLEDESRFIGTCKIPDALFSQMQKAPLQLLQSPFQERVERLYNSYGHTNKETLVTNVQKLTKRLGTERASQITQLILQNSIKEAIAAILPYYDDAYLMNLRKRSHAGNFDRNI